MTRRLHWRVVTIVVIVVAFAAVGIYPILASRWGIRSPGWLIARQLRLGLDLQGGVYLVLRPQTDVALRAETEQAMDRLRATLRAKGLSTASLTALDSTHIELRGVPVAEDAAFREIAVELDAWFERSSTAGAYLFAMKSAVQRELRDESLLRARETIVRRVNELGVTEPTITTQGADGSEIVVQLPGVGDVERAKQIIGAPGLLEVKLVEQGPAPTQELLAPEGHTPDDLDLVAQSIGPPGESSVAYYLVRRTPIVTGRDLRSARPSFDENNQPSVSFTLGNDGGRKFAAATAANIGRQLAIVLDGRVRSVATIENRIASEGSIHGGFTQAAAQDLALVLRAGALPVPLTYLAERKIGASLGADAIRDGVIASVVGLLLVVMFMLGYYKLSGVNATIALIINLIILVGMMAYVGAVMTLPGIAGLVLTIGIGVDSNVLIFERIKEELQAGRGVRAAVRAGFSRVFLTLLDTHVAALVSAAFLFQFGTGPIRGFAVTLSIGLLSNLFTSTFVSRTLYEIALARRREVDTLSI